MRYHILLFVCIAIVPAAEALPSREKEEERCAELLFGSRVELQEAQAIITAASQLVHFQFYNRRRATRADELAESLIRMMTGQAELAPTSPLIQRKVQRRAKDENWLPTPTGSQSSQLEERPVESLKSVLKMVDDGKTTKTITAKYKWFRRDKVEKYRQRVAASGSPISKIKQINEHVAQKCKEAREDHRILRGWMIRHMAARYAQEIGANEFFKASATWLKKFLKEHKLGSRKITKKVSRAQIASRDADQTAQRAFIQEFSQNRVIFPRHLIMNWDQSGFEYEHSSARTLSYVGERDTLARVDQANKATHSYTIQPLISRTGRAVGKLLICFQEREGRFGPRIASNLKDLEREYGNVVAFASTSGKMSTNLMLDWIDAVVEPALEPIASTSRNTSQPSRALVLGDSWGGNTNQRVQERLKDLGIKFMKVPKGATSRLQPLDVHFFIHYKLITKRIALVMALLNRTSEINSREGILNVHSLVWNQFSAPMYEGLIRYGWRNLDSSFSRTELPDLNHLTALQNSFDFCPSSRCQVENCTEHAFIRCAHCQLLCIHHFLARECFHNVSHEDNEGFIHEDDLEMDLNLDEHELSFGDFNDEDFDADLFGFTLPEFEETATIEEAATEIVVPTATTEAQPPPTTTTTTTTTPAPPTTTPAPLTTTPAPPSSSTTTVASEDGDGKDLSGVLANCQLFLG